MTFRMTPPFDLLLRGTTDVPVGVYQLQLTTAEQLTRVRYSPNSIKKVMKRLKILSEHDFLQRRRYPLRDEHGNYHNLSYYTLGKEGMTYLQQAGYDTHDAWRAAKAAGTFPLFVEHTLELNDILISAALLQRVSPTSLIRLDHFVHERILKRKPYKTTWQGNTLVVIPDAFLKFQVRDTYHRLLLEHDRGTEEQQRFRGKIRGYIALLKEEPIPVVFTTFAGNERLEQIRGWAQKEVAGERSDIAACFLFANLTHPPEPSIWLDPIWFGTDEQVQRLIAA